MSNEAGPSKPKDKPIKQVETNPKLDVTSDKFDPLLALRSETIILPKPNVKIFDNISILEAAIKNIGNIEVKIKKNVSKSSSQKHNKVSKEEMVNITERRFLPHQMPVRMEKRKKFKRNILTKLEEGYQGPLGKLKMYMDNKERVKVYIRRNNGIRGYITGFIEAFDKHWNLAMIDVIECWKRRKDKFKKNSFSFGQATDMSKRLKQLNIEIPEILVKNLDHRHIECRRKIPQIMIRGEQVSHIILDDTKI